MARISYSRNTHKKYDVSIKETGERHSRRCLMCNKIFVARTRFYRTCEYCRKTLPIRESTSFAFCVLILFLTGCSTFSMSDYVSLERRVTRTERAIRQLSFTAKQTKLIANSLDKYFNGEELELNRAKDGKCLEMKLKYGDKLDWKEVECQKKKK